MSTTVATDLVVVEDPSGWAEASAVAGFLAAYRGSTRVSYATDFRLFSAWSREANRIRLQKLLASTAPRSRWPPPTP